MRCDFCGYEIKEEEVKSGCQSCPFSAGCKMIKCPRCNYEIPKEAGLVKILKKIFGKKKYFVSRSNQ